MHGVKTVSFENFLAWVLPAGSRDQLMLVGGAARE